jgi:transposase
MKPTGYWYECAIKVFIQNDMQFKSTGCLTVSATQAANVRVLFDSMRQVCYWSSMAIPAKKRALIHSGTLNPHPEHVRSDLFKIDFFDPCDRAQVKYEMLRAHSLDGDPVAEVCRQFGFSRESFYQIQQAFAQVGFASFLPGKRGRKGPVKLKGELLAFALEKKQENPDMDPAQLAALIQQRYDIEIHRTTVMRAMKKKRRATAEEPARGVLRER